MSFANCFGTIGTPAFVALGVRLANDSILRTSDYILVWAIGCLFGVLYVLTVVGNYVIYFGSGVLINDVM